jgi:hypothetical protein
VHEVELPGLCFMGELEFVLAQKTPRVLAAGRLRGSAMFVSRGEHGAIRLGCPHGGGS